MRAFLLAALLALLGYAPLASAGTLVVIVNPRSGVEKLDRYQVLDLFLGRNRQLPSGIAALPIDLAGAGDERAQFYRVVARKDPAEISAYWARLVFSGQASPPFRVPDSRSAVDLVAGNPSAIAYVDSDAVDKRVRVVLEIPR